MLEREVKLSFDTAGGARAAVLAAGATPARARRLQEDALFDTADGSLRQRGCALRVRTERRGASDPAPAAILTFKGPLQPGAMKTRDEHETTVGNREALLHLLDGLGLRVSFRYEKYREEFAAADLTIAIDETPVGVFVELEGGEQAILAMTRALGRSPADFILDSYYRLFVARREQFGLGEHMTFGHGSHALADGSPVEPQP